MAGPWQGDTSGSGSGSTASSARPNTIGVLRRFGNSDNIAPVGNSTAASSSLIKIQAEGPVKRVRLHIYNAHPFLEAQNWQASIAPTEKGLYSTITEAYSAWQGGTPHNVLASTTEPYGFRRFTWNGASSSGICPSSNTQSPGTSYTTSHGWVSTDWLEIGPDVPCTDVVTDRRFFVLRTYRAAPADIGVTTTFNTTRLTSLLGFYEADPASERLLIGMSGSGTDYVNSPGIPGSGLNTTSVPVITVEFDYGVKTRNVWHVGDSITEGYRWNTQTIARKSTAAAPWTSMNLGGSTTGRKWYTQALFNMVQHLNRPDYVMFCAASINDYSGGPTLTNERAIYELGETLKLANWLNSQNITPIIWTAVNFANQQAAVNILNNGVRAYCANGNAILVDIEGAPGFDYSVYNASTNPNGLSGDGTHPADPTGIAFFANVYANAIASL